MFGDEPVTSEGPAGLLSLLDKRTEAKANKDWAAADQIRDQVTALGWKIVDAAGGARLEKL